MTRAPAEAGESQEGSFRLGGVLWESQESFREEEEANTQLLLIKK